MEKNSEKNTKLGVNVKNPTFAVNLNLQLSNQLSISSQEPLTAPERDVHHPTTDFETLIHLLKGCTGVGILALPEAFSYSGLWVGLICTPLLGFLALHCMHLVLKSSRELCRRKHIASLSYEQAAKLAFETGPVKLRKFSSIIHRATYIFLIVTQLGFCCIYFVFIAQNMFQAMECITGGTPMKEYGEMAYMIITLLPVLLIVYIPDLKYLSPVSLIAYAITIGGIFISFYFIGSEISTSTDPLPPAFNGWAKMPHFFGIATFAFEGIGLVLPLENNMKTPNNFPGRTGVLSTGILFVMCIFVAVGFFGYMAFGDDVLGSVTLNLPGDLPLAQSVKILLSLAIFLTYPLQLYVVLSVMTPSIVSHFKTKKSKFIADYAFRTTLVLFTFVLAAVIPNIGLFTNLIGAFGSSSIAYIFPPLIDIATFWPDMGRFKWRFIKDLLVVIFGLFGFTVATALSITEIVDYFSTTHNPIPLQC